jgi:hypothetical protein
MSHEFQSIKAYERLEELTASGIPHEDVEDHETAQQLTVIQLLEENAPRPAMPRSVEFRKTVVRRVQRQRRDRAWMRFGLLAAVILAGFIWLSRSGDGPEIPMMISDQALAQADRNAAREDMLTYLEKTEKLLVSMRDFEVSCAREQMNISLEQEMARNLLLKQKLFAPRVVYQPEFFRARQLLDDLERILVDVNGLDPCTDPMDVDLINEHVYETRLLNKLRIIAQEIRVS